MPVGIFSNTCLYSCWLIHPQSPTMIPHTLDCSSASLSSLICSTDICCAISRISSTCVQLAFALFLSAFNDVVTDLSLAVQVPCVMMRANASRPRFLMKLWLLDSDFVSVCVAISTSSSSTPCVMCLNSSLIRSCSSSSNVVFSSIVSEGVTLIVTSFPMSIQPAVWCTPDVDPAIAWMACISAVGRCSFVADHATLCCFLYPCPCLSFVA